MKKNQSSLNSKNDWNLSNHSSYLARTRLFTTERINPLSSAIVSFGNGVLTLGNFCFQLPGIKYVIIIIATLLICNESKSQELLRPEAAMEAKLRETLKKNAEILRFMENKGQLENKNILYYYEGKKSAVYIEKTKIRFVAKEYVTIKHNQKFLEDENYLKGTHTFTLNLNGADPNSKLKLGNSFSTKYNYFFGKDSSTWRSGINAAKDLTLENVYPGIDIRLYSSADGSLEFDWILKAGADYSKINMLLDGQDKLSVDKDGSLNVGLRFTDIKFKIPESYQVTDHGKVPVDFAFNTDGSGKVNFKTNSKIDARYPLVIDPILTWGTFMDGNDPDFDQYLFAIQVDPIDGMVYCAGASNREISTSSAPYDANGYLNTITGFGIDATPRVAIVYRVNSGGSDLVDLTLYGPGTVAAGNEVAAYGLSLSNNRVFISGRTTVDLPMTGSPFDGTRNGNDGFVAVFSRDLGTLHYATYLGSSADENLGATSIRATNDNTFFVGLTATAALPGSYISLLAADNTFGGASEMYIAKFSSNNSLQWGTYVGGNNEETFNDLEVFSDGRVAFAGWGNNTNAGFQEHNSAAPQSDSINNPDGIIGILNSSAVAFNYLDEIGGDGFDRINDVEIINGAIAWTGFVSAGFPTSSGAYDQSHNGAVDVVVGTVGTSGGSGTYKATFYGGGGIDIGAGIKKVSQFNCAGVESSFLLVFGTTEANAIGIPTVNINNESFYSATNQGGLDIFFAGFSETVNSLVYATNIGGIYNDYLGDTGDPRGANHLWVKGGNIYVGTTTHSDSHVPAIIGGGGFDQVKTNIANPTSDDTHILFSIEFSAILETDYSDAPSSYGAPSHILDCTHLRINNVDSESGPLPSCASDGSDKVLPDDEDGISTYPTYTLGGPQNISFTVNNILNTTGSNATLYAWIDLNNDGHFSTSEFTSVSVANGFSGNKTLTWTGVTVSGIDANRIIRLRLTTDALNDDPGTAVDERSTVSASDGEVEDYAICEKPSAGIDVNVNCASLPAGSATMNASGSGNWTAQTGNPGTAVITTPSSPTTTITTFSAAGTYYFIWTNPCNCARDTMRVFVTAKPNAGTDKNVICAALPGGNTTMSASGTGTWSIQSGNPGISTITTPSSATTGITNFSTAGTYNYIWTNASGCPDTASVIVTAKPNAGVDQNVNCIYVFPGGSATMAATGAGNWSIQSGNPGTATITNTLSATTTITNFSADGTFRFIWTNASGCSDTAAVIVTQGPIGNASPQTICSGTSSSIALNSTVFGTSYTWTAAHLSGGVISNFSNCASSCGTSISQILNNASNTIDGVVRYTVTPTANACVGNPFDVDVTVNPKPAGSASPQTICSGGSTNVILNSTLPGSTYTWTAAQFSGGAISGFSNCASSCGTTIIQTLNNASNSIAGVVRYTVTPVSPIGCIGNSFTVDVTVNPKPAGSASPQTICTESSTSVNLNSTILSTTFTWTAAQFSGSTITGFGNCSSSCGTTISQILTNTSNSTTGIVRYTVIPTSSDGCIGNSFTVDVTVNPKPTGSASPQTICSGTSTSVTLNASLAGSTYTWTAAQSSGSTITGFSNCTSSCGSTITQALTNTSNTILGVVRYTVTPSSSNGCIGIPFTVDVTVNPGPSGSATPQTICSGATSSVALNASIAGSTFTWTAAQFSGSAITGFSNCASSCGTTISQALTNTSNVAQGVVRYTVTPTSASGCIGIAFTVDVTVNPSPAGSATPSTICSETSTSIGLNSTLTGSTFTWTAAQFSGATITGFSNCASSCGTTISQILTNTSNTASGVVRYTVTPTSAVGCIGNSFTVNVTVNPKPTGSASPQSICSGASTSVALNASIAGSTYTWTAAQFSGSTITGFSNCAASCGSTITQTLINTSNTIPGIVRYTVTPTSSNGCIGIPFTVDVTVNSSPTGSATPQTICTGAASSIALNASIAGSTFTWTAAQFSGSAITGFSNCNSSCGNTIIQSLNNTSNVTQGVVRYTVTPTSAIGCVGNPFTVDVTVNPAPAGSASPQSICSGTSTSLNLNSTLSGSSYTWTAAQFSGATISGFSNCASSCGTTIIQTLNNTSNFATGDVRYTVTPTSSVGCIGNNFTVNVTVNPLPIASVSTTPACIGVSNGTATASASGGTAGYNYSWSNGQLSTTIVNIPAATYTVTATDVNGCKNTGTGTVVSSGISNLTAVPGICQSLSNSYSLTGSITFQNAPSSGTLTVSADGKQQVFNAPFTSPQAYTLNGLTADSAVHVVTAIFSGGANCSKSTNFNSPANCSPRIWHNKSFLSYTRTSLHTYDVLYRIIVYNDGGFGYYDLKDNPAFDDDININSASFTTDAPGNAGGNLVGTGNWILANDQSILAHSIDTFILKVNVTINLNAGSGGDNVYKKCGQANPGSPTAGEALYNESSIDTNEDGIPEQTSKACGDLPYLTHQKTIASITPLGANKYQVNYQIVVKNLGGAAAPYDLSDVPSFDNDIAINSASYTSNAAGNPGTTLNGAGPWILANDLNIGIGAIHTYQLIVKVTIDLNPTSNGDNIYKKCGQSGSGSPIAGEGLFNKSRLDTNNDGVPDETSEICGDLPYVTHDKTFISATSVGSNVFNVVYTIVVKNLGGVAGQYDLVDAPSFDDDIAIMNASYASNAAGNSGSALTGSGPWKIANDQNIIPGDVQTYTLTIQVVYDISPSSGGDNAYRKCGYSVSSQPKAGEGLFNESRLDTNNDGVHEEKDQVCGDLPDIAKYGSKVWDDKNGNGIQDVGEGGVQGITVDLYDAITKVKLRTTVTDVNGIYLFENLKSQSYYAKYTLTSGWFLTTANQGLDSKDSDVDGSNGPFTNSTIFLDHGEVNLINDAGLWKCATITGFAWLDDDMDGIFDPEEKGINGLGVYLVDALTGLTVASVQTSVKPGTTSSDGYYHFDCIKPGMYWIRIERPINLAASWPYQGNDPNKDSDITHENGINTTKKITVLSADLISNIFGGFQMKSQVGDKVWIDQNGNGIQDSGEQSLAGVKVSAFNVIGNKVSESESAADGKFMLDGLAYGSYYVKFEIQSKYGFTKSKVGIDDMDSDVDGTYGYGSTKMFSISPGEVKPTIDAGVVSQALALKWLGFDGKYNGSFTELNWVTGVEEGNDHFEIERKFEGEKDFVQIENVVAHPYPDLAKHEYSFDDFTIKNSGIYYYRLKQVDKDGEFTYSKIISIRVDDGNESLDVSIYPNPANDLLKIELWIPEDTELEIKVYDNNGKTITNSSSTQYKIKGKYDELLQTNELISGQYILQIKTSSEVIHKKFTVSK